MKTIRDFIKEWNTQNRLEYYEAAQFIWEHPELSWQEFQSMAALTEILQRHGFDVQTGVAEMPTAFIATYGSGRPVLGINAEYDALPGLSQKLGVTQKEAIGKDDLKGASASGHGCGHNLLGTAGVKAAIAIRYAMERYGLSGTIKVIGAPAEELCLGKPYLGKHGFLTGFDAILDWHPWSYNRVDYDECSAYFSVKYHYKGRECHGNSPWHGRSALDAAMLQAHGVEMLREHIYPGAPPDAANTINYTFCETGPSFPSVVPNSTTVWYVGRLTTTQEAEETLRRVTNCAKGAALATDTSVETELITATHHKIPNKTLATLMHQNFTELGAPAFTEEEQQLAKDIQKEMGAPQTGLPTDIEPLKGSHTVVCDTSEYSWNAPYVTAWIAMGPKDIGWHNWGVTRCGGDTPGQKSLDKAAELISLTAADLFTNPSILAEAQREWKERMKGLTYQCLLPEDHRPLP